MQDFKVDGILCEVTEPLCISHTGSKPYYYAGKIIVEKDETYQVTASYKGWRWSALFEKDDSEEKIRTNTALGLRAAIKRLNRKIA